MMKIIDREIKNLFQEEMNRMRGVNREYVSMLKRRNFLEAKVFKRKFEKMHKHLSGMPSLDATLNPFKRPHNPSVFSESQTDDNV